MSGAFVSLVQPPDELVDPGWWFALRGSELLVLETETTADVPQGLTPLRRQFLGRLEGRACWSVELESDVEPPDGMLFRPLRALYGRLGEQLFALAGRASQIVEWDRTHQFCGRCGTATAYAVDERAKSCPSCGLMSFPRLSPAVIVRVARDDRILLARSPHFAAGMYSVLAGFVEPGESLEEAVAREIDEEVGISVADVRYFGSQPWPFPHSLMIGFTARYAGGEIRLETREIEDAGWFSTDRLPSLPGKLSIARRLIDSFVEEHGGTEGC
jgi:NAD+ diphosphatase